MFLRKTVSRKLQTLLCSESQFPENKRFVKKTRVILEKQITNIGKRQIGGVVGRAGGGGEIHYIYLSLYMYVYIYKYIYLYVYTGIYLYTFYIHPR